MFPRAQNSTLQHGKRILLSNLVLLANVLFNAENGISFLDLGFRTSPIQSVHKSKRTSFHISGDCLIN